MLSVLINAAFAALSLFPATPTVERMEVAPVSASTAAASYGISLVTVEGYVTEIMIGGIGVASITPTPVDVFYEQLFGATPPQTLVTKWIETKGLEQTVTTPCINFLTIKECSDSHDAAVDARLVKRPLPPPPKMEEVVKK